MYAPRVPNREGRSAYGRYMQEPTSVAPPEVQPCLGFCYGGHIFSPHIGLHLAAKIEKCRAEGEFTCLTVDSTAKPTLPLLGQVGRNRKRSKNKARQFRITTNCTLRMWYEVRGDLYSWWIPCFREISKLRL